MKTIAVIPIHGRIELAKLTHYACQAIGVDTLAVCSSDRDYDALSSLYTYCLRSSLMFPSKIDHGLAYVQRESQYSHILMIGCDDIILPESWQHMVDCADGYDVIAVSSCYMYDSRYKYVVQWPGYPIDHARHMEPCGAFRLYNRSALDRINWSLYDCSEPAMDAHSWELITSKSTYKILNDIICVDIKDQHSMTQLHAFNYLLPVFGEKKNHILTYMHEIWENKNILKNTREGVPESFGKPSTTSQPLSRAHTCKNDKNHES